ncbi:tail fiber domain-containing protein [bacterium]|nr:tail fiber domain-containing protein [bacterium]
MPTVKKLVFANGVNVTEPVDLSLETATNSLPVYANDAAFIAENDLVDGSIYLNTTLNAPRLYLGGVWRTGIVQQNATDPTKTVSFDLNGCSTGADNILDFNSTADRTYTFPDISATVVLTLGAQELQSKTIKDGFLDGTKIRNNALDVEASGALTIGASVGANNLTLGGATSTVSIPGNLTVSGTTTTVNTTTLDVKDSNITINKNGTDATSVGSGFTVDRTGTKGSLIYKSTAPNKFAAGDLGSEKNIAAIDDITATNLTGTILPSKGGTGISNNDAATLTRSGNHAVTLTTTATTSLTLPTSGTLATLTDVNATQLTGTLLPTKGGTGVSNNDSATLTRTGNFDLNITTTAASAVTMPTTGTLATLSGSETLLNKSVSSTAALTGALKLPVGNATTERPTGTAAALKGMIRYNDTDDVFEGYNELAGWASIGGGGTTDRVTQASHGFVVGDVLWLNGSTYAKAIATAANTAEVIGVVSRVIDASTFEVTLSGEVSGLSGLTAGEVYFLSASTSGLLTTTEPTTIGYVSVPIGIASSATTLYVSPKRGVVVGATNARTQISLLNNTTTTVQNISAYDAGELTGWVSISATTPLRFYVRAVFSKNGAANDYNVSYQVSGDTPPTGFVVTATAAGLLQVTLPSITGFSSASINYALNAPAIGTSFPLSVQSSSVVYGSVIETGTGSSIEDVNIKIGSNRTGSGNSYLNLHSQSSVGYSARIVRYSGANGDCAIDNAGTGNLVLTTNGVERFRATTGGIELRNVSGITYVGLGGTGSANAMAFKWSSPNVIARIDNAVDVTLANVSDYRIKRDVETQSQPALERIKKLRPVSYKMADYGELFKSSEDVHEGFLAHELQEIIPSSVVGKKDDPDQIQSLNLGALCSVLVKASRNCSFLKLNLSNIKSS